MVMLRLVRYNLLKDLDKQMYAAFGSIIIMIIIYTSLAIHNIKNPRIYLKRNKTRKHTLLKALLEQQRKDLNDTTRNL